jgi:hypothetical protein
MKYKIKLHLFETAPAKSTTRSLHNYTQASGPYYCYWHCSV